MIIECINCGKKFNVNPDLIPSEGRNIQCGSCNHLWFYSKNQTKNINDNINSNVDASEITKNYEINNTKKNKTSKKVNKNINVSINSNPKKKSEIVKYQSKSTFTFGRFLSYIIVALISFVAFVILLDTFKVPLYEKFPDLELILFNLFETIKDINLFIRDLI